MIIMQGTTVTDVIRIPQWYYCQFFDRFTTFSLFGVKKGFVDLYVYIYIVIFSNTEKKNYGSLLPWGNFETVTVAEWLIAKYLP